MENTFCLKNDKKGEITCMDAVLKNRLLLRKYSQEDDSYTYDMETTPDGINHAYFQENIHEQAINDGEKHACYEQCTGYTDKNNQLIYDGDIVSFDESPEEFYMEKVIFDDLSGSFVFADSGETVAQNGRAGEVIGNIHRSKVYFVENLSVNDKFKKAYINELLTVLENNLLNPTILNKFLSEHYTKMFDKLEAKDFNGAFEHCLPALTKGIEFQINFEGMLETLKRNYSLSDNHCEVVEQESKISFDLNVIDLKEIEVL